MINWQTKIVNISDLKDYPYNPRRIGKKEFDELVRSVKEDGYHQRIMVDTNNVIIGGHMRKEVLKRAGINQIEVLYPDRELSEREFKRLNIRDNLDVWGDFDNDKLANYFDTSDLISWGMEDYKFDLPEIDDPKEEEEKEEEIKLCHNCGARQ